MNNTERPTIDSANLSPGFGQMPPELWPQSLTWQPPSQTDPFVVGTLPDRLRIYADADHKDVQEYVPDVPNPNGDGGNLINYWPGYPGLANYVLTLRSYWAMVPNSYTQVHPGGGFQQEYSVLVGISTTDAESFSRELGVDVEGGIMLSDKLSAGFGRKVTTSSLQLETTPYTGFPPSDGMIRVWMLWQLVNELVALDPTTGNVVANPKQRGDVNWSLSGASGAFLQYTNLHQHFPEPVVIETMKDFPKP